MFCLRGFSWSNWRCLVGELLCGWRRIQVLFGIILRWVGFNLMQLGLF
ncbi:hypothetical protein ES332_A09G028800v1 [Gossypium tomentosum]|uniref:Uncharacterized protein n=1 Tax=Gossypium tomentosum TaxID=34277 RepID=A0A5D2NXN2_GOSTO|nr:hypothetical protein ES332_A09G028800v1 [Gossypium tomentosum]